MNTRAFLSAAALSCLFAILYAVPDAIADPDVLLAKVRPSIVQITVIGEHGGIKEIGKGTGFVIDTAQGIRVLTAAHVIKPDSYWDDPKNRLIYISWSNFGSTIKPEPVTEAIFDDGRDVAQVYIDPFSVKTLKIVNFTYNPIEPLTLYIPTWPKDQRKAIIKQATVSYDSGPQFSLSGKFDYSESGSPVIDGSGQTVGILTDRTGDEGGKALILNRPNPVVDAIDILRVNPVKKLTLPTRTELNFDQLSGNCTFLGKRSALSTRRPEDMPFGEEILRTVNSSETREKLIGAKLSVVTPVNIRSKCPTILEGFAYYGKIITRMQKSDTIRPRQIFALNYLDDVFYWTTFDSAQKSQ